MKNIIYCLLLLSFLCQSNIHAQSETEKADIKHSNHSYQNEIAVFIGGTSQSEKSETNFTLGADYLRLLSPHKPWIFGLYGEAIFAAHTEYVFGAIIAYKITPHFWIRSGPGIEILQEASHGQTKTTAEFLYRVGMGYSFHMSNITISPSLDFDFVRHHDALVWGINIGKEF